MTLAEMPTTIERPAPEFDPLTTTIEDIRVLKQGIELSGPTGTMPGQIVEVELSTGDAAPHSELFMIPADQDPTDLSKIDIHGWTRPNPQGLEVDVCFLHEEDPQAYREFVLQAVKACRGNAQLPIGATPSETVENIFETYRDNPLQGHTVKVKVVLPEEERAAAEKMVIEKKIVPEALGTLALIKLNRAGIGIYA